MKSTDLKLGVEYAVIPCWQYSSADKKDANRVPRNSVMKAVLVSMDKYEYQVYRSVDVSDPNFKPAPAGSRSIGYKVEMVNPDQPENTFSLSRPQDIVAEYATLEDRWTREESEQALKEAEQARIRAEQERKEREAQAYVDRMKDSIMTSLRSIIGKKAEEVRIDTRSRYNGSERVPTAEITLDLRSMEMLIEKVLEAQDMVG